MDILEDSHSAHKELARIPAALLEATTFRRAGLCFTFSRALLSRTQGWLPQRCKVPAPTMAGVSAGCPCSRARLPRSGQATNPTHRPRRPGFTIHGNPPGRVVCFEGSLYSQPLLPEPRTGQRPVQNSDPRAPLRGDPAVLPGGSGPEWTAPQGVPSYMYTIIPPCL